MTKTSLIFPTGEFTHTELAQLNKQTNQQVWVRYQQAIKDGVIISAGNRPSVSGKGKPSKLWKVNPNPPSPVTVSAPAPVAAVAPAVVPTEPIVVPAVTPAVPTPEAVAPVEVTPVPEPAPAAAPVVAAPVVETPVPAVETTAIVEVVRIETTPPEKPFVLPPEVLKDVRTLSEVCPICSHPLSAMNDATGVVVWCGQPKEICPLAENPYGHANTDKNAYEILIDKFTRKGTVAAA
jgi:hypothetical protein